MISDGPTLESNTPCRDGHFTTKLEQSASQHMHVCRACFQSHYISQSLTLFWKHIIYTYISIQKTIYYVEKLSGTITITQRDKKNFFFFNLWSRMKKTSRRVKYTYWQIFKTDTIVIWVQWNPLYKCLLILYINIQASGH